ncbi:MAG: helix-turn-helix transcriptional regulator [Turicibacter sp.]|nr:helix-turn-helix transcriptional regulator [Turicibacter sp.]
MRKNLVNLRKASNLTQRGIAETLGITKQQYQRLESGKSDGSIKVWLALAEVFHTTIDHLLEQADEVKTAQLNCTKISKKSQPARSAGG